MKGRSWLWSCGALILGTSTLLLTSGITDMSGSIATHSGIFRYECTDRCCSDVCRSTGTPRTFLDCLNGIKSRGYGGSCRLRVWQQFTLNPRDMAVSYVPTVTCPSILGFSRRWGSVFAFQLAINEVRRPEEEYYPMRSASGNAVIYNLFSDAEWTHYIYLGRVVNVDGPNLGAPQTALYYDAYKQYLSPIEEFQDSVRTGIWVVPVQGYGGRPAFALTGAVLPKYPEGICEDWKTDVYDHNDTNTPSATGWIYSEKTYIHVLAGMLMTPNELANEPVETYEQAKLIHDEHYVPLPTD